MTEEEEDSAKTYVHCKGADFL